MSTMLTGYAFFAHFTRSPIGRYSELMVQQYSCNGKPLRGFRQWKGILGEALATLIDTYVWQLPRHHMTRDFKRSEIISIFGQ